MNKNSKMKDYKSVIRFSLSSILSFLIDFSFFTFFTIYISNISLCNVLARIISATFNYLMNRKYVFNSDNNLYKSALSYAILAFVIIILNTLLLNIFVYKLMIQKFLAKIIYEIILFTINFIVQKHVVFKKK